MSDEQISKDDQERKRIIDSLNEEGIELLMPIVFESSDESEDEERDSVMVRADEAEDLHVKYANSLNSMKTVSIHNHSDRKIFEKESWFDSLATENISPDSTPIDYINISEITRDNFEKKYVKNGGKPCIIRGVMEESNWRAKDRWDTPENFVKHYGNVPIKVTEIKPFHGMGRPNEIRIPISLYVEYALNNEADDPFYGFEHDIDDEGCIPSRVVLKEDYSTPSLFQNDFYDMNDETREFYPNYRHFIIGGKRTGTNLHTDPKFTSAWNTLTCGFKKWILFPPGSDINYLERLGVQAYAKTPPSYWWLDVPHTLSKDIGMIEVVQKAGETIFVPAGWWHAALNVDFTIAITHNLLQQSTLPFQWKAFVQEYGMFTNYLKATIPDTIEEVVQQSNTYDNLLTVNKQIVY